VLSAEEAGGGVVMLGRRLYQFLKHALIYVGLVVFLSPFLIVILNSFKKTQYFIENPVALPDTFSFFNYVDAFHKMKFMQGFLNTLLITVLSVLVIILFSSMT